VYEREMQAFGGWVPCWCCGRHVNKREATLEHIMPRALGGGSENKNLAISHASCNSRRGHEFRYARANPKPPPHIKHRKDWWEQQPHGSGA
jgi:5-methylcytosine-specific restriction endonuclease McrA